MEEVHVAPVSNREEAIKKIALRIKLMAQRVHVASLEEVVCFSALASYSCRSAWLDLFQ